LADDHTFMYPPLHRAMETYWRITGNEDAFDWLVAYGQAVALVQYQAKHGCMNSAFLMDFPVKGFAWDRWSWDIPEGAKEAKVSGYNAQFYPDIPARAYQFCGEPFLKQRAFDWWCRSTHPGTFERSAIASVGKWANVYSTHDESVCFSGKTFYIWAHPRKDEKAPAAVTDLKVVANGDRATVSFTAPADDPSTGSRLREDASAGTAGQAGGKVARYQVKCSDKPIVDYETFLKKFAANEDKDVTNWWMATNLAGEPAPQAAGKKESFTVTGVPANAKHFAVSSFDDSDNRGPLSNVAQVGL
jgi:hypothetical protein